MQKTIWLSYDLGVKGDYPNLYRWLDNVKAMECGDSIVYFKINIPEGESVPDFIKRELESSIEFSKTDRIYLIWTNGEGINKGRFIIGKRKASPWQGYGESASNEDDL